MPAFDPLVAARYGNGFLLIFGITGQPTANHFLSPGCDASDANEMLVTMQRACTLREARVVCRIAPGGAFVDTYTVRLNAGDTAAAPTVTATATTGTWSGTEAVTAGDEISVQYTQTGGVATRDPIVSLWLTIDT